MIVVWMMMNGGLSRRDSLVVFGLTVWPGVHQCWLTDQGEHAMPVTG
jgi:hypothetical protein